MLVKLEEVRDEMERMQKRMDVILAFAEDKREKVVHNTYERLDELTEALEERFKNMKELRDKLELRGVSEDIREKAEEFKEEVEELRIRFRIDMEQRMQILNRRDFFRRDMILSNPTMKSRHFKNALEDIKKAAGKQHKNRDNNNE